MHPTAWLSIRLADLMLRARLFHIIPPQFEGLHTLGVISHGIMHHDIFQMT